MSAAISGAMSILMSFITMLTSLFGIVQGRPDTTITQGFETKGENVMRIMSFNIRCTNVGTDSWQDRIGIVTQTMLDSEADSIGIQEGTPEWMGELRQTLSSKYNSVGVGRDGESKGEFSAIFYLKDKYNLVDSGTFWLSETPDEISRGWDAVFNRICTWAVLENKETGEKYVHLNSHFDHIGVKARANSVELILNKAKEYPDLPVVFTADLNVKQGSEDYNHFVNSDILRDTKFDTRDTMNYCTYHDLHPERNKDEIIDYVMINDHFDAKVYRVVTEGIDGRYVSDHFPIYADIVIK